jgi:hypothetical protein
MCFKKLVAAAAAVLSGVLFIIVTFWMSSGLLKPGDYTLDPNTAKDLASVKEACALMAQTVSASENILTTCAQISMVVSLVLLILNATLLLLLVRRGQKSALAAP